MDAEPLARLHRALTELQPGALSEEQLEASYPGARRAAVLVLVYPKRAGPHLVLTRRTPHLPDHAGQISLPGGQIDPLDFSPAEAALRETREELGISTDDLTVTGPLEPVYVGVSNFVLVPFVGFSESVPAFVPNPAEVAEVIELPLCHLLDPNTVQEEVWLVRDERRRVSFYRFGRHKIWGATARVLRQIVALAGGPSPSASLVPPGDIAPEL